MATVSSWINSDLYDRNFELLRKRFPTVVFAVSTADVSGYHFCQTLEKEDNLQTPQGLILHSERCAKEEAEQWRSTLTLEGVDVVYVYGMGLGYFYQALQEWLCEKKGRYLVFLEHDPAIVRSFLATPLATTLLEDHHVYLFLFSPPIVGNPLFTSVAAYFAFLSWRVSVLPSYAHLPFWPEIETFLNSESHSVQATALEEMQLNTSYYRDFYFHLTHLATDLNGGKLFGAFKGIPAIICGAGPSLEKQIPLLETLSSRALIFAGGSALTALSRAKVPLHFAAGISAHLDEVNRFWHQCDFALPFFYRSHLIPQSLPFLQGPLIYTSDGAAPPIAHWIDEQLGLTMTGLHEGCSVALFLTDLAYQLGCNPIIYVGMDLALTDQKSYADKVVENPFDREPRATLTMKDLHGKPIQTFWKWIIEQEMLGEWISQRPDSVYINATQGGIGIPHTQLLSLAEVAKSLMHPRDIRGKVHAQLQECQMQEGIQEKVQDLFLRLTKSVQECIELVGCLLEELAQLEPKITQGVLDSFSSPPASSIDEPLPWHRHPRIAYLTVELEAQLAYRLIFDHMLSCRQRYHQRLYDEFLAQARQRKAMILQRKLFILQECYRFLEQSAKEHLEILCTTVF